MCVSVCNCSTVHVKKCPELSSQAQNRMFVNTRRMGSSSNSIASLRHEVDGARAIHPAAEADVAAAATKIAWNFCFVFNETNLG